MREIDSGRRRGARDGRDRGLAVIGRAARRASPPDLHLRRGDAEQLGDAPAQQAVGDDRPAPVVGAREQLDARAGRRIEIGAQRVERARRQVDGAPPQLDRPGRERGRDGRGRHDEAPYTLRVVAV
ncbi:hypothetical protein LRS13_18890 [Svornostia abyssi]|uniref:Uncharacterized protein n=1 Tax=Svornostia abyssi TaxID=2898438 RepID=A0ABY5PDN0_9ACTN|nr:hypothetical protein LRS13_18890 [Parviterribacteraceae bacterium J379]